MFEERAAIPINLGGTPQKFIQKEIGGRGYNPRGPEEGKTTCHRRYGETHFLLFRE